MTCVAFRARDDDLAAIRWEQLGNGLTFDTVADRSAAEKGVTNVSR